MLFFSSCVESRAYCDQYRDIDEDTKLSTKHINHEVSILPLEMHNSNLLQGLVKGLNWRGSEFNLNDIRLDAIWGQDNVHKKFFRMNLLIFRGLLRPDTIQEEVLI